LDFVANGGGIAPLWVQIARRVTIASNGRNGFADYTAGSVSNVALEGRHVHLIGTTDGVVDPKPRADAQVVGTSREVRNIERLECASGTILGYRHDDKIIGFYIPNIGLIRNS
jgi:hypothetical protein